MRHALMRDLSRLLDAPRRALLHALGAPTYLEAPVGWLLVTWGARRLSLDHLEAFAVGCWLPGALRGVSGGDTRWTR